MGVGLVGRTGGAKLMFEFTTGRSSLRDGPISARLATSLTTRGVQIPSNGLQFSDLSLGTSLGTSGIQRLSIDLGKAMPGMGLLGQRSFVNLRLAKKQTTLDALQTGLNQFASHLSAGLRIMIDTGGNAIAVSAGIMASAAATGTDAEIIRYPSLAVKTLGMSTFDLNRRLQTMRIVPENWHMELHDKLAIRLNMLMKGHTDGISLVLPPKRTPFKWRIENGINHHSADITIRIERRANGTRQLIVTGFHPRDPKLRPEIILVRTLIKEAQDLLN